MSIENYENLDLREYIDIFKDESIDMEILSELTSEDLKEIGIKKLGHRKIILKAISEIHIKIDTEPSNNNDKKDELSILCGLLPKVISSP